MRIALLGSAYRYELRQQSKFALKPNDTVAAE